MIKQKEKGITLVALVITVIVTLILAGVGISLITGENGLFTKANHAASEYSSKAQSEATKFNELMNYLNGNYGNGGSSQGGGQGPVAPAPTTIENNMTLAQAKGLGAANTNVTIKAPLNAGGTADQNVVIPAGFILATDTGNYVNEGIVIKNATDGNEFVWIPVADSTAYTKTWYGTSGQESRLATSATANQQVTISGTNYYIYYESQPTDEADSIDSNHGFYFGRYEAGSKEDTAAKTMRSAETAAQTVTVQKDQVPYNCVAINSSKAGSGKGNMTDLAASLGNGYSGNTFTKLCSSYAWDTVLNFVGDSNWARGTGDPTIAQNYSNAPSFEYKKFNNGAIETATRPADSTSNIGLIATGQGTATKNIYDMGGNCGEYTSESYSSTSFPYVVRGSYYSDTFANRPAGSRYGNYGNAYSFYGFRLTLFL